MANPTSPPFSQLFLSYSQKEFEQLSKHWSLSHSISENMPIFPSVTYSPKPSNEWNPYDFENVQTYHPLYYKINPVTPSHETMQHRVLNGTYLFHDLKSVYDTTQKEKIVKPKSMFFKFSPLLDPLRYLTGKYGGSTQECPILKQLPTTLNETEQASMLNSLSTSNQKAIRKLYDANNASYVDSFFYYLSSQLIKNHSLVNGIDFYGSFLAVQKKFRMNIYDDITYLKRYSFFNRNLKNCYHIYDQTFLKYLEFEKSKGEGRSSRKHHKVRLELSSLPITDISEGEDAKRAVDTMELLGVEDLCDDPNPSLTNDFSNTFPETLDIMDDSYFNVRLEKKDLPPIQPVTSDSMMQDAANLPPNSSPISNDSIAPHSEEEEEDDDSHLFEDLIDEDEEQEEDEASNASGSSSEMEIPPVDDEENETLYAYIDDFPVQMICMETCEGTLDQLFVHKILNVSNYDTEGASMLFQVIATLIAYQQAFHFTHNDLHTNNIMWISTPIQYLYYQIQGHVYRIPTYNRIYKIIDFGRAIYDFQGQRFCSDSFASPEGDASTQYNCEPYLIPGKPILEPNHSFDLCRLACAVYDFLVDVEESEGSGSGSRYDEEGEDPEEDEGPQEEESNEEENEENEEEEGASVWEDMDANSMEEIPDTLFAQLIIQWCEDDKGKSMLYTKSGKERYPYFKLYQMIARTVHRHIPLQQIHNPLFAPFLLPEGNLPHKKKSDVWIDLDALPDYSK